ncbi:LLM class flavin-dependent oxidoreductase [Actinomadura sp. 21ATH]|uniref:LLM class flavin-dependent oxidoreductase n=1 Tax=Actinomadura sp. 21ATH TaxID=1735444 RepID=UPI0035C213D8
MSESLRFHIVLPSRGEERGPGALPPFVTDLRGGAYGPYDQLAQIARAAEIATFHGVLAPFDAGGEESFVVASGVLRHNRWLRAAAGFHPGIATPVYAAKVSASLQRFSSNRLDWRVEVDLDEATARAQGDFLTGADRYARAAEFLTVAKGVWHEEGYTYEGRYFQVLAGGFAGPLAGGAFPRVHLSGTSPEALDLSARHADVHVFGPADDLGALVPELRDRAAALGRAPAFGVALPVLAREDEEEALAEARRRTAAGDPPAGVVGSYAAAAEAIREYAARGVTAFFLDARPRIEEIYRLGEQLLPLLAGPRKETEHAD